MTIASTAEEIRQERFAEELDDKAIGFNVSMRLSELKRLNKTASELKMSRSELVRRAIKQCYFANDS